MSRGRREETSVVFARSTWIACGVFLAATLGMFGDVLFSGSHRIFSKDGEDLASLLLYWHEFGFDELRKGNLALWNPHIFSGAPFFGAFQPALLYPPNWLHLVLPLATAINVGVALHFFMAGMWTYLWVAHRRLHPLACVFAGVTFMFCGAYFLQLYRGHLPNLRTIVWAPLIFLAVDGLTASGAAGWLLLGSGAVAMQVLAGHVQYVFYTGVIAGIYGLASWTRSVRPSRTAVALLAMYPLGASLAAIQLLPGLEAVSESLRSGLRYDIARTFAFPPENVLTLVLPGVFGDMISTPYWGRWTLSEMSLYIGTGGLLMVACGIVHGEKHQARAALAMALIALVLSFGCYTPLFRLLYDHVPGFASFRGIAKFAVLGTLFLVMLEALGFDYVLRTRDLPRWPPRVLLATGALFILTAVALLETSSAGATGPWAWMLGAIDFDDEAFSYYPVDWTAELVQRSGETAAESLLWAGGALGLLAALWWASRHTRAAAYGIAVLGTVELFTYALHSRPTFDPAPWMRKATALREFLASTDGESRVLGANPYLTMSAGAYDLWGYDPMILRRYAGFIALTQGLDPDTMMVSPGIARLSPLFSMLRLRYVFHPDVRRWQEFASPIAPLPRALLISRWRVLADEHAVLSAMRDPAFDPRQVVLLEAQPEPAPVASSSRGSVSVIDVSSDTMEIHADVPDPTILLVTDNYSRGWRVSSLNAGSGQTYSVVPADYTLLAIPLAAGRHDLRLEYAPRTFRVGAWVTLLALLAFAATGGWLLWHRPRVPNLAVERGR